MKADVTVQNFKLVKKNLLFLGWIAKWCLHCVLFLLTGWCKREVQQRYCYCSFEFTVHGMNSPPGVIKFPASDACHNSRSVLLSLKSTESDNLSIVCWSFTPKQRLRQAIMPNFVTERQERCWNRREFSRGHRHSWGPEHEERLWKLYFWAGREGRKDLTAASSHPGGWYWVGRGTWQEDKPQVQQGKAWRGAGNNGSTHRGCI